MIGKTISHYRILEKIGEGGMGVVYKAEDTKLERTVALKFFTPQILGTEEDKTRFILEAQAAAALDHPNICTIYEIDEADGQTFIAMAYVDGQDLADKVESGPLDVKEAVDIAIQVAEGLAHAHKKGIVHRDIKSANIMVTEDGKAKIMDFGLAKLTGRTRLTKTSTIMGTVAYMSPEQAGGELTIDHRTDIWSLGVVLYKMLTAKPPFDAPSDAALIHKIIYEEMEPVSKLRADIPSELEKTVHKMLQKDPQKRYEDMAEVLISLKSMQADLARAPMDSGKGPVPSKKSNLKIAAFVALLLTLCAVGIIFLRQPKIETPIRPETATAPVMEKTYSSIAVLPFANISADPDQEHFCDGMAEELINALAQLKNLRVIARTSAFSFKGRNLDVREIGKRLNVDAVLEGSVRKAGNRLRITAQLIDVEGGHHLWSERYDRQLEDVFAIQDEITLAIVDKLKVKLLGDQGGAIAKRSPIDPKLYDLYLRGIHLVWERSTEEDLETAIEHFEDVIEDVPGYAPAYVGMANAYNFLQAGNLIPADEAFPKARAMALKALQLDDTLADAHAVLAWHEMSYERNWEAAEKGLKRALELNPSEARTHVVYAWHLGYRALFEDAIDEMKLAHDLDPLSPWINSEMGVMYNLARQYDKSIEVLQRALELDPDYPSVRNWLIWAYRGSSQYERALKENQKLKEKSDWPMSFDEVLIYAQMGKKDKAQEALDYIEEKAEEMNLFAYDFACVYSLLGETDETFEWLEEAYEEHERPLLWLMVDSDLDNIRSDPRYFEMLKKIGLEPLPEEKAKALYGKVPVISSSPTLEDKTYSSIAVLPFVDMSQKKDQEYFCDGMSETLINELTQIKDLRVIARTSAFSFKGQNIDVREIGKKLGVDAILEGSIQRAGNRLRITAQLVDTKAGHHLWSKKYDREMKGIFALQDEISQSIVDNLMPELVGSAKTKIRTARKIDPEAYDLYLMGRHYYYKMTEETSKKAFHYFEQAIEKDPECAPAYSGLADAYIDMAFWSIIPPKEAMPKARGLARKALEIDSNSAEAHVSMGWIRALYDWDWEGAERELKQAIELNPGYLEAHRVYAEILRCMTRFDDARREARLAVELDPLSPIGRLALASAYYRYDRQYDKAMEQYQNILEMDPEFIYVHVHIGGMYIYQSKHEEALQELKKHRALSEGLNFETEIMIAVTYALMGKKDEARKILETFLEQSKKRYIPPYFIAQVYACLGEKDKSYEWAEKAYEEHDLWLSYLKRETYIDILDMRSDPRYHALLKKIGLDK